MSYVPTHWKVLANPKTSIKIEEIDLLMVCKICAKDKLPRRLWMYVCALYETYICIWFKRSARFKYAIPRAHFTLLLFMQKKNICISHQEEIHDKYKRIVPVRLIYSWSREFSYIENYCCYENLMFQNLTSSFPSVVQMQTYDCINVHIFSSVCLCLFQLIVHLTQQWIKLFPCHLHTLIRIKRILFLSVIFISIV